MVFSGLVPRPVLTVVNNDNVLEVFRTEDWISPLRVRCLFREKFRNSFFMDSLKFMLMLILELGISVNAQLR